MIALAAMAVAAVLAAWRRRSSRPRRCRPTRPRRSRRTTHFFQGTDACVGIPTTGSGTQTVTITEVDTPNGGPARPHRRRRAASTCTRRSGRARGTRSPARTSGRGRTTGTTTDRGAAQLLGRHERDGARRLHVRGRPHGGANVGVPRHVGRRRAEAVLRPLHLRRQVGIGGEGRAAARPSLTRRGGRGRREVPVGARGLRLPFPPAARSGDREERNDDRDQERDLLSDREHVSLVGRPASGGDHSNERLSPRRLARALLGHARLELDRDLRRGGVKNGRWRKSVGPVRAGDGSDGLLYRGP